MSAAAKRKAFAARPSSPDDWVRAPGTLPSDTGQPAYTARLTVDVTPELRGRIKVTAFQRGLTVANMLRALLEREYPAAADERSDSGP